MKFPTYSYLEMSKYRNPDSYIKICFLNLLLLLLLFAQSSSALDDSRGQGPGPDVWEGQQEGQRFLLIGSPAPACTASAGPRSEQGSRSFHTQDCLPTLWRTRPAGEP